MPLSFFTSSRSELSIGHKKYVLSHEWNHQQQSQQPRLIGIATCITDSLPYILFISSTGLVTQHELKSTLTTVSTNPFTNGTENNDTWTQLECELMSTMHSVTHLPNQDYFNTDKCNCKVILHGSLGSCELNVHSQTISNIKVVSIQNSILYSLVLCNKPLIQIDNNNTKDIFTNIHVTYSGKIYIRSDTVLNHVQQLTSADNNDLIYDMVGFPCAMFSTYCGSLVVVISEIGSIVILYPDPKSKHKVAVKCLTFPVIYFNDKKCEVMRDLQVIVQCDNAFYIQKVHPEKFNPIGFEIGYNNAKRQLYVNELGHEFNESEKVEGENEDKNRMHVIIDDDDDDEEDEDGEDDASSGIEMSEAFKTTLNEIEKNASELEDEKNKSREYDEIIKSYNTALLFLRTVTTKNRTNLHTNIISNSDILKSIDSNSNNINNNDHHNHKTGLHCDFSFSSHRLFLSNSIPNNQQMIEPCKGIMTFINVRLYNGTKTTLAKGWSIHIRIDKKQQGDNDGISDDKIMTVINSNLQKTLYPNHSDCFSFHFQYNSHQPLYLNCELCFNKTSSCLVYLYSKNEWEFLRNMIYNHDNKIDKTNLNLSICHNVRLDVLQISNKLNSDDILNTRYHGYKDISYKYLTHNSRIVSHMSDSINRDRMMECKQRLFINRFQVPINRNTLCKLLGMNNNSTNNNNNNNENKVVYETLLQGIFEISIENSTNNSYHISHIRINAAKHLVPFIKEAIVYRVFSKLERADGKDRTDMKVINANKINEWLKGLVDKVDESAFYECEANQALVSSNDSAPLIARFEQDELDDDDMNDIAKASKVFNKYQRCVAQVNSTVTEFHDKWGELISDHWSPSGAEYIPSTCDRE